MLKDLYQAPSHTEATIKPPDQALSDAAGFTRTEEALARRRHDVGEALLEPLGGGVRSRRQ